MLHEEGLNHNIKLRLIENDYLQWTCEGNDVTVHNFKFHLDQQQNVIDYFYTKVDMLALQLHKKVTFEVCICSYILACTIPVF